MIPSVRKAFAHYASLRLVHGGDEGAPGAAITVALCGHWDHWDHEPPCPLSPHHTHADRVGNELHLRTLFAVEPEREDEVRQLIDAALAKSLLVGPNGSTTSWQLLSTQRGDVRTADVDHVKRLVRTH